MDLPMILGLWETLILHIPIQLLDRPPRDPQIIVLAHLQSLVQQRGFMKGWIQDYIKGNFQGLEIIAMTGEFVPAIKLQNLDQAHYFPNNQTYDVTKLVADLV